MGAEHMGLISRVSSRTYRFIHLHTRQIHSSPTTMSNKERTFIAIKPDGVQRGLIGEIITRFEKRGYKLVAMKLTMPGLEHIKEHYSDLSSKGFYAGLCNYMNSGPICAMVWEGKDAVKQGRCMLGETNPLASKAGSIRGDYCLDLGRNICHGSDAVDSAEKKLLFGSTRARSATTSTTAKPGYTSKSSISNIC